ncbi:MAG: FAD:protein FMN transferase [Pollutimonas bauzanensis]
MASQENTAAPPCHELRGRSMGTTWTVKIAAPVGAARADALDAAIQQALERITRQMSTWEADSVITVLNQSEPGWYQVPEELFHVLGHALDVARQTGGAYDPTVGGLVDLWGFGPRGAIAVPPADSAIAAALAQAGWHRTALNAEHRGVWQPGRLQFDLSSIAKGYGADQIAAVLDRHAIEHYLVELGGELKARGLNPRQSRWALGIDIPGDPATFPISLSDCAIATSGDYRRHFEHGGRRYGHTLDPRTGRPLLHSLASVSVLHRDCMLADALATALLCLGPGQGPAYARANGIAALFMHRHPHDIAIESTAEFRALARC